MRMDLTWRDLAPERIGNCAVPVSLELKDKEGRCQEVDADCPRPDVPHLVATSTPCPSYRLQCTSW
jgi:hypothetical protein